MPETSIHETAIVSPKAILGAGVSVGPFSIIDGGASVGDGTVIGAYVHLTSYVEIGRGCHIYDSTVIGHPPQDHDFAGETSYVRIEDDVVIRENVTVHRATGEGLATRVGKGTMLMEGCHLGHNVKVGQYCTLTNKAGLSGHVLTGDYVVIGGLAGLHQFVRVGSYAMVGGMAKVVMDVPPYSLVDGNPASMFGLNSVGLRRRGFDQQERNKIKKIYKLLFEGAPTLEDAMELVSKRYPDDGLADGIIAFARESRRGLYHWRPGSAEHRGRAR
ncbi:MAG: acyl-ACP--UDP-N-acetylglucosamine O-acyltransferase [Synergistaceae bacterium]|jgi:UDP-N-acetylglucosamine acyltransferase|nr:acyl-ACP--UDP-N-acetylglucosamine O-acyltransferase [Synergistaceae bacterium]